MSAKSIDVVTTSRADLSYTLPLAAAIAARPGMKARLLACGPVAGHVDAGAAPCPVVSLPADGLGQGLVESGHAMGDLLGRLTALWAEAPPDLVVLPCDRYEVLAPATAAMLLNLPLGHLYGGEEDVAYSIDTRVRNALTKMAHCHFVMHEATAARLRRMGEEDWRIAVCGSTSVSALRPDAGPFLDYARERGWGEGPFICATYLPLTTFRENSLAELEAMIAACRRFGGHTFVWNSVNADPGGIEVRRRIEALCAAEPNHVFVESLGARRYFGLLSCAAAVVGNSSSGLVETAGFGVPTVNVGIRQTGRLGGENLIFVPAEANAIARGLRKALFDQDFRKAARAPNPFVKGDAAALAAEAIAGFLAMPAGAFLIKRAVKGNPRRVGGLKRSVEFGSGPGAP